MAGKLKQWTQDETDQAREYLSRQAENWQFVDMAQREAALEAIDGPESMNDWCGTYLTPEGKKRLLTALRVDKHNRSKVPVSNAVASGSLALAIESAVEVAMARMGLSEPEQWMLDAESELLNNTDFLLDSLADVITKYQA